MKKLPKSHLSLLAAAGAALLIFLAVHFVAIRPLHNSVTRLREDVSNKENALRERGWPLELERLRSVAARKQEELQTVANRKDLVLTRATSLFNDKIVHLYENWQHFEQQISRLDYQQEYLRIERKLREMKIDVHPAILQLSEDSTGPRTFELILQLWTLEAAAERAVAYGLTPVIEVRQPGPGEQSGDADDGRPPVKGAAVTVLPPHAFYLHRRDPAPYLLQFGVKMRLTGSARDVHRFLAGSGGKEAFLAVPRIEIYKPPPERDQNEDDAVVAELICSAYYLLNHEIRPDPEKMRKRTALPAGA